MASLMLVNPRRRKRRVTKKRGKKRARRRNPIAAVNPRRRKRRVTRGRKRRSYRRNPSRRGMGGVMNQVQNAVMPAVGAIGLDLIMGYLPLPEMLKTGPMRHLVKGAAAIGLGMIAGQFMKKSTAEQIATGALTVTMYNAGKEVALRFMPNLPLGLYEDENMDGMGYYSAGYNPEIEMEGLDLESQGMMGMGYDEGDDEGYESGFGYIEDELEL